MNKYLHPINFTEVTYHKKVSLVPGNRLGEFFYHSPAAIVECVSKYISIAI